MDYIEMFSDTVVEKGKEVADKAKEMAQIAKLKSQISACQGVVDKNYMEIGKLFYEANVGNADAEFAKQRKAIKNAQRGIFEFEEQIAKIKAEQK